MAGASEGVQLRMWAVVPSLRSTSKPGGDALESIGTSMVRRPDAHKDQWPRPGQRGTGDPTIRAWSGRRPAAEMAQAGRRSIGAFGRPKRPRR